LLEKKIFKSTSQPKGYNAGNKFFTCFAIPMLFHFYKRKEGGKKLLKRTREKVERKGLEGVKCEKDRMLGAVSQVKRQFLCIFKVGAFCAATFSIFENFN